MTNEDKGMGKGLLIGLLTGAAVGSVLALLYAPKSGKDMRKLIKTKSQDIIEDTEEYYSNAKEKATQLFRDVKKKSEMLFSDAEEKVDGLLHESEKILADAKEQVISIANAGKQKNEKENQHLKNMLPKSDRHQQS
ncbi:MAG: YtxH domain-containing protein [Melioribacteraceae bacterium]|nr:MAG: YtxH domain-containing protein [Melioribacteraceae bacterium]